MNAPSTRNLLAKSFCYRRERLWAAQDNREPIVSLATIEHLQTQLHKRPIAEIVLAAQELGIKVSESYEC